VRGATFTAPVDGGHVGGWVVGAGAPVLLLHGGPGISFSYLEDLADELADGYEVAAFQQRGIEPSMITGPYDVDTHLGDIAAVLDHIDWQMAYVVGHSWGGHLSFHVAVSMPERSLGVLAVDPLGAVGDGGRAGFEAEMVARLPAGTRQQARQPDDQASSAERDDRALAGMRRAWPAYFADTDAAPPMPPLTVRSQAYSECFASLTLRQPALEAALPAVTVPVGILAGARSPLPAEASRATADRIPGCWVDVVADAGHFPWFERPGCVRSALDRLAGI
jgi:pimeloyl-ACP methyl ester carboxylesterase